MMRGRNDSDREEDEDARKKPPDKGSESQAKKRKADNEESSYAQKWSYMFERLKEFKKKHGHCRVPNRYTEEPQLGNWVSTQRRQYRILTTGGNRSVPLSLERARQLMDIGFEWSAKDPTHKPWHERFEELKSFQDKYGHTCVPMGWQENPRLATWVSTQRQEYKLLKQGHSSRLNEDKVMELDSINFTWEAPRGRRRLQDMPETKSQEAEMSTSQSSSLTQQQVAVASEQPAPAPAATALNFLQALSGNPGLLSGATQEQGATNPQWAAATSMSQESLSSPVISQEQLLRLLQQTSGHERSGVQEEVNTNLTGVHNQAQVLSAIQSLGLQIHGPAEQPSMRVGSATSPSIRDQLLSLMQPREYQNLTNSNNASSASNQGQTSAILQQILNRSGATVENPVQRISQLLQGGQNVQNQILQLRQDPTPRPLSALEETLAVIQARGPISNASTQQLQNAVNLNLRGGNEVVATRQLLGQDLLHLLQHNSSSTQSVPTSSQTTREMLREAFLAQLNEASRTQQSQRPLSSDQQGILAAARQQQQQQPQQASEFNLSQLLSTNLHNQATQRAVAPPHDTNRVINASLESVLYHQAGRSQQGQVQQQQRQQRNSGSSDDKKPAALGPPTKKPRQE